MKYKFGQPHIVIVKATFVQIIALHKTGGLTVQYLLTGSVPYRNERIPDTYERTLVLTPFIRYHLPPMVYALLVIALSSIPYLQTPFLHKYPADKILHFCEYAVFAAFTFRSFYQIKVLQSVNTVALGVMGILAVFAGGDELYQSLIPGRRPDIYDFATDLAGVALTVLIMWVIYRRRLRRIMS
jgi:VanZ family protein